MSIDLTKLSPIDDFEMTVDSNWPDHAKGTSFWACCPSHETRELAGNEARFYELSRNAFDVMMRRGWGVVRVRGEWLIAIGSMEPLFELRKKRWSNPFAALVEADQWYAENVEKQP